MHTHTTHKLSHMPNDLLGKILVSPSTKFISLIHKEPLEITKNYNWWEKGAKDIIRQCTEKERQKAWVFPVLSLVIRKMHSKTHPRALFFTPGYHLSPIALGIKPVSSKDACIYYPWGSKLAQFATTPEECNSAVAIHVINAHLLWSSKQASRK